MASRFAINAPRSISVQTTSAILTGTNFLLLNPSSHVALILLSVPHRKTKTPLRCYTRIAHRFSERIGFSLETGVRFLTEARQGSEPSHTGASLARTGTYGDIREPDVSDTTSVLK